jgi:uncharacterized ion transporter superfamily protein YfcC
VTVLTFQYGAGLTDLIIPTSGSLMAILALAKVRYEDWLRWVFPVWGLLILLGCAAISVAIAVGL